MNEICQSCLSLFFDGCRPRVFLFSCSLFVLHAWCSGSVRVVCCAWCAVSVWLCTRHFCPLCSRFPPVCFQVVSCWIWCIATSESYQDRLCQSAAKCDKHCELFGQRFFFIPHESESHRESHSICTRDFFFWWLFNHLHVMFFKW